MDMDESGAGEVGRDMEMMKRCVSEIMRAQPQLDEQDAWAMCQNRMRELQNGAPPVEDAD